MDDKPAIVKELRLLEELGQLHSTEGGAGDQVSAMTASVKEIAVEDDKIAQVSQLINDTYFADLQSNTSIDLFKEIIELSPDGIVTVDLKGMITSCNPAACAMLGYDNKELLGKHYSKIGVFKPKDLPKYIWLFAEILKGSNKGPIEVEYVRKDGTSFVSEVHITRFKRKNHVVGLLAISRDITERRNAEKKLKRSERRYRELYEGSRDGFALVDLNGRIIESNSTFRQMVGYTAEELAQKTYQELTPQKWHTIENQIIEEQVMPQGYSKIYEKEYRRKDGKIISVEIRTYLLEDDAIPKGLWSYVRDISDRKAKENELLESKSHFERLFNSMADPVVIVDKHGTLLEASEAIEKYTGYTRDELVGKNFLRTKLVTTRSKALLLANLAKRMTGISIPPYEIDVVRKDGKILPAEVNASRITFSGKAADMVVFRDTSERHKAQQILRESEEKFRIMSEQSLMGIAIIQENEIKYVNDTIATTTKYTKEELLDGGVKLISQIIHPDDKSFVMNQLEKKLSGDNDVIPNYCYRIITKDGEIRWLDQFSKTIYYADNKADFITTIDITDKVHAEERIKQQNKQLKKIDKLKSDFLNITSHELRSPMTAMKGYLHMLTTEILGTLNEEQKHAAEVILRNTNRLDHLVQDILDTSRLESGTMKFIPTKTNINTMINEIIETMQSSANIKHIQIQTEVPKKLPCLTVDQERIKQVFNNIINNAIKFSPEKTKITIRAKKQEKKIEFQIQDQGKGIPKTKQNKIFETFYQVESGVDRTFGGTGLGLTISRGIIMGHGGKIWVESKSGKGSTFKFTLPITPIQDVEGTFKKVDIFSIKTQTKIKDVKVDAECHE